MSRRLPLLLLFGIVSAPVVEAQAPAPSPYAGMESRRIAAVSPEREKGLLAGAGLGYAMAAELNGHPGPKHVLEMGDQLALTAEQRAAVAASFAKMQGESVALGRQILDAEELLNRRFAHQHIDETVLAALTGDIAALEGKLRLVHLRAHLETDAILSAEQRAKYVALRGYGSAAHAKEGEHVHGG